MLPSAVVDNVGALVANFRSSIPSPFIPLFTLRWTPHSIQRKTRGRADRCSFLVRLFHPLFHAGCSENKYNVSLFHSCNPPELLPLERRSQAGADSGGDDAPAAAAAVAGVHSRHREMAH